MESLQWWRDHMLESQNGFLSTTGFREGRQILGPTGLMERMVWSPLTYMWICVGSHVGWGIFSYSILAPGWIIFPVHPLWHRTESLDNCWPSVFLRARVCVCVGGGYSQGKLVSWVYFELKISWAVCFLWAIYRCFLNYLCVWGIFFFMVSAHHFLQVITLKQFCRGRYSCRQSA